jgi:type I restriction enzyme S subunit
MGCMVAKGDLDFVFVMLQQLDLGRLSKPGPVPAIGEGEVREIKVVVPPEIEQKAVVRFIQSETKDLATAIARLEREIELISEYRTCLVADVVAGTLDVREAADKIPDDIPLGTNNNEDLDVSTEAVDEETNE